MGYSIEFINNLPKIMQTEIMNLSLQIDALEKQNATLQLPKDIVVSYELLDSNNAKAKELIDEARKTASDIIASAQASADATYNSAKSRADADLAVAAHTVSDANQTNSDALALLESAKAFQSKVQDQQNLVNLQREKHEANVIAHQKAIASLITNLSGKV